MGVLTLKKTFFKTASASLFALSKSTRTNFVQWSANTMQNWNPDADSTLKSSITSVNTLSSFTAAWVSIFFDAGTLRIWPMRKNCIHHRLSFALSACSSASSMKPTVSDCEKSSMSLSSSDSESLRLPLLAIDSSSGDASSSSNASRLKVVFCVFTLSASSHSTLIAVEEPCFSLLSSS